VGSKLCFDRGEAFFQLFQALMYTTQELILGAANDYNIGSPTLLRSGASSSICSASSPPSSAEISTLTSLGIWNWLWFHWFLPKNGCSVIGPSLGVPFIPFFFRICVSRNGNGSPYDFVVVALRAITPSQNF
jgi:hypothetical protein